MEQAAAQESRPVSGGGIDGGSIDVTNIRREAHDIIAKFAAGHSLNNVEREFLADAKYIVMDIIEHGQEDSVVWLTPSAISTLLEILDNPPPTGTLEATTMSNGGHTTAR